jgi:hypothetical protein
LSSCAAVPPDAPAPRIVEVPVPVYVKVDERLTQKSTVAVPDTAEYNARDDKGKLLYVTALYHWNTTRLLACYFNLDEIAGLGND